MKTDKTIYNIKLKIKRKIFFLNFTQNIKLNYEEATIREGLNFLEILDKPGIELLKYLEEFFVKYSNKNRKYFYNFVIPNLEKFVSIVKDTKFKSIFDLKEEKKEQKKSEGKQEPFEIEELEEQLGRLAVFLAMNGAEKNWLEVLETYTYNQLSFAVDQVIWLKNEETEEGRKENEKILNKKYFEKNKETIEEQLKRIDLFYKNQKTGATKKT